ncbi:MAG TPA: DUF1343 domain-containing protein [Phycisphaerae bacterium]|nr:DUF1343 domain-containing protein [Phycisphaerae bacterium]HOJ72378.1 DUF1343 domain-containing protein [Phycisphaerae bacterium]HOM49960.1 DUF1343 domain-containing protein [Phycisphaerae bacterium]HON68890.1 DUF1343 domain-containing protein [Phycisphaerae bacterium]HOQ84587.1 DUF1343 domain-containing protein [Phycisphaerae bacterium]
MRIHYLFPTTGLTLLAFAAVSVAASPRPVVQTGIDVLEADGFKILQGKRVGLITNPTGVTWDLRSTADVLFNAKGVRLVALFGPEHGIRANIHAGDHVQDDKDAKTGLPVYSLYGKTRKATPEMLKGIDLLVYDVQDVGSRSYTYISTMALAMEAAAENNIAFVVLDRPNPLTGNRVEGRPLDLKYKSFVGHLPIPYIYGMTCGELARMINGEGWLAGGVKCDLTVVPMKGWTREMWFDQTGLVWVPTSPHVPRKDSALFYAATGIMGELQVLSEGVGYTLPFELAGAPFVEPEKLAQALNDRHLPGVVFRPLSWKHYYLRDTKSFFGGVQVHLVDRDAADLTSIQFHIMDATRRLYPDHEFFGSKRDDMFDKVCGTDQIRKMFLAGKSADEIVKFWNSGRESFMKTRAKYLMYK